MTVLVGVVGERGGCVRHGMLVLWDSSQICGGGDFTVLLGGFLFVLCRNDLLRRALVVRSDIGVAYAVSLP